MAAKKRGSGQPSDKPRGKPGKPERPAKAGEAGTPEKKRDSGKPGGMPPPRYAARAVSAPDGGPPVSGKIVIAAAAVAMLLLTGFWQSLNALRVFLFSSVDSFWLVQTGLDIISQLRLPQNDIYSFTHYGQPWLLYQWLFELMAGLLVRAGGLQALQAAVVGVASLLFAVLALQGMIKKGTGFWVAWLVCEAATCASFTFITARPHLVSLVMVYLVQRILDRHWAKPGWAVLWLVPLFLLWANCHIMFAIGLAMVTVYWLSAGVVWLQNLGGAASASSWQRFRLLFGGLILSVGATLANPYGWELYVHGLAVSSQGYWGDRIGEVMVPEFSNPYGALILNYIVLAVLAVMLSKRRPALPEGVVFLGLLAAGLTSYKILPYFVVATMHGTGLRLQPALSELVGGWFPGQVRSVSAVLSRWASSWVYALLIAGMAVAFGLSSPVLFPPWVPVRAADYLEAHPIDGKMFCSAKYGSYLIWRFHGRLPVFIDTRFDMYGPAFSDVYFQAHRGAPLWRELFARYGITYAMVSEGSGIAAALRADPGWKAVYEDKEAAVFVSAASGK